MEHLEQISENVFVANLPGNEVALVQLATSDMCTNRTTAVSLGQHSTRIRSWGQYNDLPQRREEILKENNIVGPIIATKKNITLGAGLQPYREFWNAKEQKYDREPVEIWPEAQEFFDRVDIDEFIRCNARNLFMQGQIFPEYMRGKGNGANKIAMVHAIEAKHIRAAEQNEKGELTDWIFSAEWVHETGTSYKRKIPHFEKVENFRRDKSFRKAVKENKALPQAKFIWRLSDSIFFDGYYFEPAWWGGREWIELANCIPEFHRANLRNGYTLRYQIMYRSDYFNVPPRDESDQAKRDAQEAAKNNQQKMINRLNDFLAGLKNTGRAVYTRFEWDKALMKEIPGIIIKPIQVDLHDTALLKLFEKSNEANISGQGIHPTLANIQTQGKLSSGSEMRIAYQTYLAIHTPEPRKVLLSPINLVHRVNNWMPGENIKWGFRDIEITKLDVEKTGQREVQQTQAQ